MEPIVNNLKFEKYSKYKDSGVDWLGNIPIEWERTRLGSRFIERKEKVSDKDFEPLSVTKKGILPQLENAAKTNDGDNRKLVKAGDFVINSRSDRKGSSGLSKLNGSVSLINIVLELKDIKDTFCHYFLKSHGFIEEFYRNGHGIVADLWTTRYNEMRSIIISVPSYDEQIRIADFLDRKTAQIDKAISQKEKLIELLKERRQVVIQEAVTKGLNPNVKLKDSGIEWIGKIPEHWEIKRLASIGTFSKGFGISRDELIQVGENAILYGDIYTKYDIFIKNAYHKISKETAKKAKIITRNMLLFTGSGETIEDIGKCVVYLNNETAYAGGDVITFKQVGNESLFLSYALNSNIIKSKKAKCSKGEIIVHIYASKLKNIYIPIPSFTEQQQISKHIERQSAKISKAISQQEKLIEKLKEYRTVLIDSAVTGKIKV